MAPSLAGMAQTMLNSVVLVFTLLAGMVVFLRLITRGLFVRKAGAEDAWIALAMILSITFAVAVAVQVQNGLGQRIGQLTPLMVVHSLQSFWASIWIYNLALTATKISILTQYLRVFPDPRFRLTFQILMVMVALYGIWAVFGSIFLCFPVAFFWDKTIPNGKCLDQKVAFFTNAAINIALEITLLILPLPLLRTLNLPRRQKGALFFVFGIGGLECLSSIVRLGTLRPIANSTDPTLNNAPAAMLSAIEQNVGIICACLPALRPLLAYVMPNFFQFQDDARYPRNQGRYMRVAEPPKHFRNQSMDSRPYTADTDTYKSNFSQLDSATSWPNTRRSYYGASHTRKPSIARKTSINKDDIGRPFNPILPLHSQPGRSPHSRNGSESGPSILSPGSRSNIGAAIELQPPLNPLRMSPYLHTGPRLPQLPEDMAVVGPLENNAPAPARRSSIKFFHKPLPITPLPGQPTLSQYATLPIMLSPGLMPQSPASDPGPLPLSPDMVPKPLNPSGNRAY